MSKNFKKRKEDFTCENCRTQVSGSGYTNHCPKCLYSKHVDYTPGDRENICGGLMAPIGIEKTGSTYTIVHKCLECRCKKRNKTSQNDDFDTIMTLISPAGVEPTSDP